MSPRVRVLIADDEELFGHVLELILAAEEQIDVVGRALDGREAVALARELAPHVVVIDLSMPGLTGFDAIRAIRAENDTTSVLVLSGSDDPDDLRRAEAAGAGGYLTKERIADELVPAVLRAARPKT